VFLCVFMQLNEERLAEEMSVLQHTVESLNYRLADEEDENTELKKRLEREENEKEHYKAAGTKLDSMLNSADAAADELEVKFDNEREVKYVGIIFMHCDTL